MNKKIKKIYEMIEMFNNVPLSWCSSNVLFMMFSTEKN